jgi:hypothetical protein
MFHFFDVCSELFFAVEHEKFMVKLDIHVYREFQFIHFGNNELLTKYSIQEFVTAIYLKCCQPEPLPDYATQHSQDLTNALYNYVATHSKESLQHIYLRDLKLHQLLVYPLLTFRRTSHITLHSGDLLQGIFS